MVRLVVRMLLLLLLLLAAVHVLLRVAYRQTIRVHLRRHKFMLRLVCRPLGIRRRHTRRDVRKGQQERFVSAASTGGTRTAPYDM